MVLYCGGLLKSLLRDFFIISNIVCFLSPPVVKTFLYLKVNVLFCGCIISSKELNLEMGTFLLNISSGLQYSISPHQADIALHSRFSQVKAGCLCVSPEKILYQRMILSEAKICNLTSLPTT